MWPQSNRLGCATSGADAQAAECPPECRSADQESRIEAAYAIDPEIFDRLYEDWSALLEFQRTRGVLRLTPAAGATLAARADPRSHPPDPPRDVTCSPACRWMLGDGVAG